MENDLILLKNKIEIIEKKIDKILEKLDDNVINNCNKMGEHINFVENVYQTIKSPLEYVSNKVNIITNNSSVKELPTISNNKDINNYNINN